MAKTLNGRTTSITAAIKFLNAAARELRASEKDNPYSTSNAHAQVAVARALNFATEEREIIRDMPDEEN